MAKLSKYPPTLVVVSQRGDYRIVRYYNNLKFYVQYKCRTVKGKFFDKYSESHDCMMDLCYRLPQP